MRAAARGRWSRGWGELSRTSPMGFSSASSEADPSRAWAARHPGRARQVLEVPPPSSAGGGGRGEGAPPPPTVASYLAWRRWDLSKRLRTLRSGESGGKEEAGDEDVEEEEEIRAATGLLSHPLTFPLTLGSSLGGFGSGSERAGALRLCCVGARAEASLPSDYWREMLLAASAYSGHGRGRVVSIDFVGPDLPPGLPPRSVALDDGAPEKVAGCHALHMTYKRTHLHRYVADRYREGGASGGGGGGGPSSSVTSLLSLWDGFVLFNPGLGHPNLREGWAPTLRYILRTGLPCLLTAHSDLDGRRDAAVLGEALRDAGSQRDPHRLRYRPNPFASQMIFADPFHDGADDGGKFVRPNHSVLFLD